MAALVDDAFGHWLAGFIDGEGCFIIGGRGNGTYGCQLRVALRDDDRAILEEIRERTGLGGVIASKRADGVRRAQVAWVVWSKADCTRLVEMLDRFELRAKKARDYAIWREAVLEWARPRPRFARVASDWTGMITLRERLRAVREYGLESDGFAVGAASAADADSAAHHRLGGGHDGTSHAAGNGRRIV